MNEKKIRIIETIMWIIINVILAICDFIQGGILICFGIIFTALSVVWCCLLARYIDDYKD